VGCPGRQRVDPANGSARILNVNRARSPEQATIRHSHANEIEKAKARVAPRTTAFSFGPFAFIM